MRQLLALIALLTGLAAFAEPARAAEAGVENVSLAVGIVCAAQAEAANVEGVAWPQPQLAQAQFASRPLPAISRLPAQVILKADRARE